jgi:hypothetical protein
MRASIVIAAAFLSAACYNYNPITTLTPEPGSYVAARLTDVGSQDLARYVGPNVFVVRGRYVGVSDQALIVAVSSVELQRGDELPWAGEQVTLPNSYIASLEVRRLAKGRSLLLAGVGAGGLVVTSVAFGLIGGGTPLGSGGPPAIKK